MRHLVSAASTKSIAAGVAVLALTLATTATADGPEAEASGAADASAETDRVVDSEPPDPYVIEAETELDAKATGDLSNVAKAGEFSVAPEASANDLWNDQNPWRYGTDYIFPLTRGLDETGLPDTLQSAAMILTVPLDVANLPFGVVAGLFGS